MTDDTAEREALVKRPPIRPPSSYCCLNFGCINPEVCDGLGRSCGDPSPSDDLQLEPLRQRLQASIDAGPGFPVWRIWVAAITVAALALAVVFGAPWMI
jgi:hypothetical protein